MTEHQNTVPDEKPKRVTCPAALDPCIRLLLVGAVALGFGLYCAHDVLIAKDAEGKPKYSPEKDIWKYRFNVAGIFLVPVGAVLMGYGAIMLRRRVLADQDGIGYQGKPKVGWDRVTKLEMGKKGLLYLHYEDAGKAKVMKLDSLKLRNFSALVTLIEARCPNVPVETGRAG
ncbi:MAG: hypothetical protein HQ546_08755 [Planctomycetes bacterium]|nr:hypothetical protein [Planctomycetota bacterium]